MKAEALKGYLEREDLTMEELVSGAHQLLVELAPKQSRYKVTERPDARTIRYYINENLLPRPVSYEGGRARYSGSHLLRLLLIKKLQAEHHSLRKIAHMLEGATDQSILRELLPDERIPLAEKDAQGAHPSSSLERFPLPHGSSVDIPKDVLGDPERRRELSRSLDELSRYLRRADDDVGSD